MAVVLDDDGNIVATTVGRAMPEALMPPAVARLPRHDGRPVTYVDAWSGEFPLRVVYSETVGTWALGHTEGEGVGVPLPKGCHTERARHAIVFGLCRLCGQPITGAAWLVAEHAIQLGPPLTIWEPPACYSCLRFALGVCPVMLKLKDRNGVLYQAHSYLPYARLMAFGQPPESNGEGAGLEDECLCRGGVVGTPWMVVTSWSEWTAAQVLERATEPRDMGTVQTHFPTMPEPFTASELDALADDSADGPAYGLHDLRLPGTYLFWPEWQGWRGLPRGQQPSGPSVVVQHA